MHQAWMEGALGVNQSHINDEDKSNVRYTEPTYLNQFRPGGKFCRRYLLFTFFLFYRGLIEVSRSRSQRGLPSNYIKGTLSPVRHFKAHGDVRYIPVPHVKNNS